MSNARIIERLDALADDVELGRVSISGFRDELLGHTGAVEGVAYHLIKVAQLVWGELSRAIDAGQEPFVDVHPLGNWLRAWAAQIPCGAVPDELSNE